MPEPVGFFTDTSVCIGCKACEVACKEWNQLPGNPPQFLDGFDNTGRLDAQNYRHVKFVDLVPEASLIEPAGGKFLMMADICKHCTNASCMEVCPTDAIVKTEYGTVYIQPAVCNGCRDCISACPYGAIGFNEQAGVAGKCTFCYDRLQADMVPACAKACPTQSIQFGTLSDLHQRADARLAALQSQGYQQASLYGRDDSVYGGLGAFFLLMDKPEVYGLPNAQNAGLPRRNNLGGYLNAFVVSALGIFAGLVAFRRRGPSEPDDTAAGSR